MCLFFVLWSRWRSSFLNLMVNLMNPIVRVDRHSLMGLWRRFQYCFFHKIDGVRVVITLTCGLLLGREGRNGRLLLHGMGRWPHRGHLRIVSLFRKCWWVVTPRKERVVTVTFGTPLSIVLRTGRVDPTKVVSVWSLTFKVGMSYHYSSGKKLGPIVTSSSPFRPKDT